MKVMKFVSAIVLSMAAVVFMSCSLSLPSADEVNAKVINGESLDDDDYQTMLEYLDEFMDAGEAGYQSYEAGQKLGEQYPYFMTFGYALDGAPQSVKDSEDYKDCVSRFRRLSGEHLGKLRGAVKRLR